LERGNRFERGLAPPLAAHSPFRAVERKLNQVLAVNDTRAVRVGKDNIRGGGEEKDTHKTKKTGITK
jgi:hypothetical protein